jgi:hypothetical protein
MTSGSSDETSGDATSGRACARDHFRQLRLFTGTPVSIDNEVFQIE